MELTCHRSAKCRHKAVINLCIVCCLPLLILAEPFSSCNSLQFEYQNKSGVTWVRCIDVCPPTKITVVNRQFCCRNCPDYCARCMNCSFTNPSGMHDVSSLSSSRPHLTKSQSSPTSAEISTDAIQMLQRQLETYREAEVNWQKKEIIYIAVIACLGFGLVATIAVAGILVSYKSTPHPTSETESRSSREDSCTQSEENDGLLQNRSDRKTPVEHNVSIPISSLCAIVQQNVSDEEKENRKTDQDANTPLKEIATREETLTSNPRTLQEDTTTRHQLTAVECNSCNELQAM